MPFAGPDNQDATDQGELGDYSSFGESDSAGEMALISASFKTAGRSSTSGLVATTSRSEDVEMETRKTDQSSQDVTLSEVREQTLAEKSKSKTQAKKTSKPKRQPQRGVPMLEEFFAKYGWTRSFISGPVDPLHNPHICKKEFFDSNERDHGNPQAPPDRETPEEGSKVALQKLAERRSSHPQNAIQSPRSEWKDPE